MNTEEIARFIIATNYDQLPEEAIDIAKKCILDNLGVALAGSVEHAGKIITNYVKETRSKPESGVIAGGFRTSSPEAALANGTMAHALDYDDYNTNFQHPSAVLLPTVLALGERERLSGQDGLTAYVLGCEVGAKIGAEISNELLEAGWHATGIVGALASTAAAAKIMKLGESQIRRAIGIAASQAGGLRRNFGTDTKPFHAGNAARSGVVAVLLAKEGFTADENILEGAIGLPEVMLGKEYHPPKLTIRLGAPFDVISPGMGIKPYPTCAQTHRSITAVLELIREHHLRAEDVAQVECKVCQHVSEVLKYTRPQKGLQGKFSMQYCMAASFLDGEVTLRQFTDEKVLRSEAQDLIQRVYCAPLGVAETGRPLDMPQIVTVKLRDGREYCHQVPFPKGSPKYPMGWKEVELKFRDCARSVLSPSDTERVVELVANLESIKDISELAQVMTTNY